MIGIILLTSFFDLLQTMRDRLVSVFLTTFDARAWWDILHCNAEIGAICDSRGRQCYLKKCLALGRQLSSHVTFSCKKFCDLLNVASKVVRAFVFGVMWDGDLQFGCGTIFLMCLCFILDKVGLGMHFRGQL